MHDRADLQNQRTRWTLLNTTGLLERGKTSRYRDSSISASFKRAKVPRTRTVITSGSKKAVLKKQPQRRLHPPLPRQHQQQIKHQQEHRIHYRLQHRLAQTPPASNRVHHQRAFQPATLQAHQVSPTKKPHQTVSLWALRSVSAWGYLSRL